MATHYKQVTKISEHKVNISSGTVMAAIGWQHITNKLKTIAENKVSILLMMAAIGWQHITNKLKQNSRK